MGSGVIMAEDDDDIEIDGPEERSLTLTQRTMSSLVYHIANALELSFVAFHA
jgi:hypothetical protein